MIPFLVEAVFNQGFVFGTSCYFGGGNKDKFFIRYLLNYSKVWQRQISRFESKYTDRTMIEHTLGMGTGIFLSKYFEAQLGLNVGPDRSRDSKRVLVSGGLSLRYNFK